MGKLKEIRVKEGDYGFALGFEIKNADGTPKDLTGYAVYLKVWDSGMNVILNGQCSITDAVNGKVAYIIQQNDFTQAGQYYAELELVKAGVVENTETFRFIVEESV